MQALSFLKLRRMCDHSHIHAECAGREARMTQIYTQWIAKIIMKGINGHVQRSIPYVNIKVMKRWNAVIMEDKMKRTMSRDSETARSHPIKPVTTFACACREPDALDVLLERSLLHWHFARSSTSSTCSLHFSALLHFESEPDQLPSGLRPLLLLKVTRKMSGSDDLKSLGQFSRTADTMWTQLPISSSWPTRSCKERMRTRRNALVGNSFRKEPST